MLRGLDQIVEDGQYRWIAGPAAPLLPTSAAMAAAWGEHSIQPHYGDRG